MALAHFGTMKLSTEEDLKMFIIYYFNECNFDSYIENHFPALINNSSLINVDIGKLDINDIQFIKNHDNNSLIWELKTVLGILKNIQEFKNEKNIISLNDNYSYSTRDQDIQIFLNEAKEFNKAQGELYFKEGIGTAESNALLGFLKIIESNLIRIRDFLFFKISDTIPQSV